MLQIVMFILVIAALAGLRTTRKTKGSRAMAFRLTAIALTFSFAATGVAMIPKPLTADQGVQHANFIKVDMANTEEMAVHALQAFPDGSYILIEEADDIRYAHYILEDDGIERRIPTTEIVFALPETFGYEMPVLRYGRTYIQGNPMITFLEQRWEFTHIVAAPEFIGIWQG